MKELKTAPKPIFARFITICSIGLVCFVVGSLIAIVSKDKSMFFLSLSVAMFSTERAFNIFNIVKKKRFEAVEGICVSISPKSFKKYKQVVLIDDQGLESTILIPKNNRLNIGNKYIFYFEKTSVQNPESFMNFNNSFFLGFEDLGQYHPNQGGSL